MGWEVMMSMPPKEKSPAGLIVQIQEIHYSFSLGALKILKPSSLSLIFSSGKDVCEVMLQLAFSDFYLLLQKVALIRHLHLFLQQPLCDL